MKTILFFDRCDLTDLYISIGLQLREEVNIVHVAFSTVEKNKLVAAGVTNYFDYQNRLNYYIDNVPVKEDIIQEIDTLIIKVTDGRFNLNSSIQSDRGFSILAYKEVLLLVQSLYFVWIEIFAKYLVDLMYHEICSQYMVHIAAILCKNQGGIYRDFVQCSYDKDGYRYINIDGENFSCPELETNYLFNKKNPNLIDRERCLKYLDNYRKDYSVFFGSEINAKIPYIKIAIQAITYWILKYVKLSHTDRLKDNINYWLLTTNVNAEKLRNLGDYKKRKIF